MTFWDIRNRPTWQPADGCLTALLRWNGSLKWSALSKGDQIHSSEWISGTRWILGLSYRIQYKGKEAKYANSPFSFWSYQWSWWIERVIQIVSSLFEALAVTITEVTTSLKYTTGTQIATSNLTSIPVNRLSKQGSHGQGIRIQLPRNLTLRDRLTAKWSDQSVPSKSNSDQSGRSSPSPKLPQSRSLKTTSTSAESTPWILSSRDESRRRQGPSHAFGQELQAV